MIIYNKIILVMVSVIILQKIAMRNWNIGSKILIFRLISVYPALLNVNGNLSDFNKD